VSAEENKAMVRRFVEELDRGNLDVIEELVAPDFVDRSLLPGQEPDRESFKRSVAEMQAPFSNTSRTIDDQIAEGDKVVTWYTASSTHDRGPIMGVAPTGKRTTFSGVYLHRVVGGKIVEEWSQGDFLDLILPALEKQMRERVEQDLRVARSSQQASLPKEVPALEGWQIANHYRPAREVGGDFYDFHLLSDGRVGFVVGDATGKGVPAALLMATTCGMLRAVAQALDSCSPGEVLERVDEALFPTIPPNMFVTCFYAVLDPESGHLLYSNAGHDLPYLHRNGDCEELKARGMPLGLMPGMSYEQKEIFLHAGETALFYSDGLVEAHDPKGEMFGVPRLRRLVGEHDGGSLVDRLLREHFGFVGNGWEQEDDLTLVSLLRSRAT
jgi:predicted ester cyclase